MTTFGQPAPSRIYEPRNYDRSNLEISGLPRRPAGAGDESSYDREAVEVRGLPRPNGAVTEETLFILIASVQEMIDRLRAEDQLDLTRRGESDPRNVPTVSNSRNGRLDHIILFVRAMSLFLAASGLSFVAFRPDLALEHSALLTPAALLLATLGWLSFIVSTERS